MKFVISLLLTALLAFAMGLYFPWWTIAIAAFIIPVIIYQRPAMAFLCGFLGIFLLWLLLVWGISTANDSILASRIARILPLGGSAPALMLVSALVGGLTAGFAALTGSLLRKIG